MMFLGKKRENRLGEGPVKGGRNSYFLRRCSLSQDKIPEAKKIES